MNFKSYFATELGALGELASQGLVVVSDSGLKVTSRGWFFVRAVAMVFDRYLQTDQNRNRFSKIL